MVLTVRRLTFIPSVVDPLFPPSAPLLSLPLTHPLGFEVQFVANWPRFERRACADQIDYESMLWNIDAE